MLPTPSACPNAWPLRLGGASIAQFGPGKWLPTINRDPWQPTGAPYPSSIVREADTEGVHDPSDSRRSNDEQIRVLLADHPDLDIPRPLLHSMLQHDRVFGVNPTDTAHTPTLAVCEDGPVVTLAHPVGSDHDRISVTRFVEESDNLTLSAVELPLDSGRLLSLRASTCPDPQHRWILACRSTVACTVVSLDTTASVAADTAVIVSRLTPRDHLLDATVVLAATPSSFSDYFHIAMVTVSDVGVHTVLLCSPATATLLSSCSLDHAATVLSATSFPNTVVVAGAYFGALRLTLSASDSDDRSHGAAQPQSLIPTNTAHETITAVFSSIRGLPHLCVCASATHVVLVDSRLAHVVLLHAHLHLPCLLLSVSPSPSFDRLLLHFAQHSPTGRAASLLFMELSLASTAPRILTPLRQLPIALPSYSHPTGVVRVLFLSHPPLTLISTRQGALYSVSHNLIDPFPAPTSHTPSSNPTHAPPSGSLAPASSSSSSSSFDVSRLFASASLRDDSPSSPQHLPTLLQCALLDGPSSLELLSAKLQVDETQLVLDALIVIGAKRISHGGADSRFDVWCAPEHLRALAPAPPPPRSPPPSSPPSVPSRSSPPSSPLLLPSSAPTIIVSSSAEHSQQRTKRKKKRFKF